MDIFKKLLLVATLGFAIFGCGEGGGDPAANADPVPAGETPGTTPRPSEPGKPAIAPSTRTGTTGAAPGRN